MIKCGVLVSVSRPPNAQTRCSIACRPVPVWMGPGQPWPDSQRKSRSRPWRSMERTGRLPQKGRRCQKMLALRTTVPTSCSMTAYMVKLTSTGSPFSQLMRIPSSRQSTAVWMEGPSDAVLVVSPWKEADQAPGQTNQGQNQRTWQPVIEDGQQQDRRRQNQEAPCLTVAVRQPASESHIPCRTCPD